jgi:hypothetical protein
MQHGAEQKRRAGDLVGLRGAGEASDEEGTVILDGARQRLPQRDVIAGVMRRIGRGQGRRFA